MEAGRPGARHCCRTWQPLTRRSPAVTYLRLFLSFLLVASTRVPCGSARSTSIFPTARLLKRGRGGWEEATAAATRTQRGTVKTRTKRAVLSRARANQGGSLDFVGELASSAGPDSSYQARLLPEGSTRRPRARPGSRRALWGRQTARVLDGRGMLKKGHGRHLSGNNGFINIDFGYPELDSWVSSPPYFFQWLPDVTISPPAGSKPYNITKNPISSGYNLSRPYDYMETTLRAFEGEDVNCININTPAGRYLVRLTFWYSNYDGKKNPPTMKIAFGDTPVVEFQMVMWDMNIFEFVLDVLDQSKSSNSTSSTSSSSSSNSNNSTSSGPAGLPLCLIRVSGNPILNGFELRPLPSTTYQSPNPKGPPGVNKAPGSEIWFNWMRLTCDDGYTQTVYRFPDDSLDREWYADSYTSGTIGGWNMSPANDTWVWAEKLSVPALGIAKDNAVPQFLLLKDRTTYADGVPLVYSFSGLFSPSHLMLILYVANILPNSTGPGITILTVSVNGKLVAPALDVYAASGNMSGGGGGLALPISYNDATGDLKVEISNASSSKYKRPLLSGLELYLVVPTSIAVDSSQVAALKSFQEALGYPPALASWQGDPCNPVPWHGLVCRSSSSRSDVIGLDLPNEQLQGAIVPDLSQIQTLLRINLTNNILSGPIPTSLFTMPALKILDVSYNNLSGAVPPNISPFLRFNATGNLDLCSPTGSNGIDPCSNSSPPTPAPAPLPPSPSSTSLSPAMIGVVVGVCAAVVLLLVLALLCFCSGGKWPYLRKYKDAQVQDMGFGDGGASDPSLAQAYNNLGSSPDSATLSKGPLSVLSEHGMSMHEASGECTRPLVGSRSTSSGPVASSTPGAVPSAGEVAAVGAVPGVETAGTAATGSDGITVMEQTAGNGTGDEGGSEQSEERRRAEAAAAAVISTSRAAASTLGPLKLPAGSSVVKLSLEQVAQATDFFSPQRLIGSGGFGPVFQGELMDGRQVAVKKRDEASLQGREEFFNEVELLSKARHPNLVELIGFCQDNGHQILVYQYMPNGTVRDHLYDSVGCPLGHLKWIQRLSIGLGAAKGIDYLHNSCRPSIIHRDIKTSNILLDTDLESKVADFGLSRFKSQEQSHVSTNVKGTAGYLDPEYYIGHQLTDKSDVFSFGVVLLELISGRQPVNLTRPRVEWSIIDWARNHLQKGDVHNIIDPTLNPDEYDLDAMWKVAEVGILCVEPMGLNRPSIADVVKELSEAIDLEILAGHGLPGQKRILPERKMEECQEMGMEGVDLGQSVGSVSTSGGSTLLGGKKRSINGLGPRSAVAFSAEYSSNGSQSSGHVAIANVTTSPTDESSLMSDQGNSSGLTSENGSHMAGPDWGAANASRSRTSASVGACSEGILTPTATGTSSTSIL